MPVEQTGIIYAVHPGSPNFAIEVIRSSDDGTGDPATSAAVTMTVLSPGAEMYRDPLPDTTEQFHYNMRHVGLNYDAGPWAGWQCAIPSEMAQAPDVDSDYTHEARRRNDTIYDSDNTLKTEVVQLSGGVSRVLAKGHISGNSSDGASVTFTQNFNSAPLVVLKGGLSIQPDSCEWTGTYASTDPVYDVMEAQDLAVSGFTMYAKLKQRSTDGTTGVNFSSDNALSSEGANTALLASTSGQEDYTFTTHYSVDINLESTMAYSLSVEVARDTYDGGSWSERGSANYFVIIESGSSASQTWSHEEKVDAVSSGNLTTGADNWRLRVKRVQEAGPGSYNFTVHGFNQTSDADHGVTWPMTSERVASKTPGSADYITWEAIEVSG
jgi:hypothetical protein